MSNSISVNEVLKDIFANVNTWVHFAEAKNGAIIGINGLFLFKAIDYMIAMINGDMIGSVFLVAFISIMFIVALVISILSFFSNTKVFEDEENADEGNTQDRILIFYGDIGKYKSSKNYLKDIHKQYLGSTIDGDSLNKIEVDYAKEILINSRIASRKYKLFNIALKINLLAIFLLSIFIIIA